MNKNKNTQMAIMASKLIHFIQLYIPFSVICDQSISDMTTVMSMHTNIHQVYACQ